MDSRFPVAVAAAPLRVETTLPCDGSAPGSARRLVLDGCRSAGLRGDALDSAELLVSEVVTNAVIHGRSDVRLRLLVSACSVRVEVADDNSRHPAAQPREDDALDGRGLTIVDMVASAWGVVDDGVGKTVWFEIAA